MPRRPIPSEMQAVTLSRYGEAPTVARMPVPTPGAGQVLVRMAAAPINPSDLASLEGGYAHRKDLPAVPGIEGSGTVVAAGSGFLPRLLLGRRVACASSPDGGGTWAEYMLTSANLCVPLQRGVTLEQGSMLLVNPLTALALWDIARREGHRAVVQTAAASSVGRMILRVGLDLGIPQVCVVRRHEHVATLEALGAEHVLVSTDPDFAARLRDLSHELRATLLLDPVAGEGAGRLLEAAPPKSTLIVYSDLSREAIPVDPKQLFFEGKRLRGFYLQDWTDSSGLVQTLRLTGRAQRLLGSSLGTRVRRRLPLSAAAEALRAYRDDMGAGKILLVADPEAVPQSGPSTA